LPQNLGETKSWLQKVAEQGHAFVSSYGQLPFLGLKTLAYPVGASRQHGTTSA
jgi:hypothetical protein